MRISTIYMGLPLLAQLVSAAPHLGSNELVARNKATGKPEHSHLKAPAKATHVNVKVPETTTHPGVKVAGAASYSDVATTGFATQNGGTKGGAGGASITVTTVEGLVAALSGDTAAIVIVSGTITGAQNVRIGSNKTLVGLKGSKLVGIGLHMRHVSNVIIRNIVSEKVLASCKGDAIRVEASSNIWVDHCDLSSDRGQPDKDLYDGLLDVTHGSDWVTVSNCYLHNHWKASLIGHSDAHSAEDIGHLHVTQHNNHWYNIGSRMPSLRLATAHVYNSYFEKADSGIDTRDGAQCLVQSNVWVDVLMPLGAYYTDIVGYANAFDNDFGIGNNTAPVGKLTENSMPYKYDLLGSGAVKAAVVGTAGATLDFA